MVVEKLCPEKSWCLPEKKHFWARAGLPPALASADHELISQANALYLLALEHIQPLIYYLTAQAHLFPVSLIPDSFGQIESLTVFVSTLGHKIDQLMNDFSRNNQTLELILLDAWSSESLEALNRYFDHHLRQKHGFGTRRFSPGYGSVDMRMNLFIVKELLQVPESEIKVLESGVMLPRKTTTCLIGWHHEPK